MQTLKRSHLLFLSIGSGVLLSIAWPENGFPGLLFIGLTPLFLIEETLTIAKERFSRFAAFFYSYPGFLLWNTLTTWWIYNSTDVGAILAIVLNSMFMSIIFQMFHYTRAKLRNRILGYLSFVFYWISLEYLHLNWDLNWPWLNLGNGFGAYYKWVEWYEYTGAFGGTLWVLVGNLIALRLLFLWIHRQKPDQAIENRTKNYNKNHFVGWMGVFLLWIGVPIGISYLIYNSYQEPQKPVQVVVVQPNINPYSEQYSLPASEVIQRIMKLAEPKLDSTTQFLVAPESAIQQEMWENELEQFQSIDLLRKIVGTYPRLNLLVGSSTFYAFQKGEKISPKARKFTKEDAYYMAYNTAILVTNNRPLQLYHKSKLTPGVESLPSYPGISWLENFAIDLGGTVGSLGVDSVRRVYQTVDAVPVSPIICYESIFGEFFAEFVRNGAQILFIITNDGWWGNTAGHRQHFAFAHLRAIETRRSIARSANTGISAFIDQRGDAHQVTKYWVPAAIKASLNANSTLTFYVQHGDYIARIAVVCAFIALGGSIFLGLLTRFSNRKK